MRLYLVRHAQTAWNNEGRAQGHTDIPLDAVGEQQAECLREAFMDIGISRILTSDLERSYQTAAVIARTTSAPLEKRPDLRERSFGDWEGMQFHEFGPLQIEESLRQGVGQFHIRPPNGESFQDVWDRLDPVVVELQSVSGPIAVVTHGGTASLLLAKLLRGTLETSRSFSFGNTGITEMELRPEGLFKMIRYNDASHLRTGRPLSGSLDGVSR